MKIWLVILVIIALWGALGLLNQLIKGFKKTNLNDQYVWGVYIQGCFFFSSVAAGILMILSVMILLEIEGVSELIGAANAIAFSLLLGAQVMLGIDLGKPMRGIFMLTSKNLSSPLTWDFYTLGISTLLSFLYLLEMISNQTIASIWAIVMLLAANLCIAAHTMFFLSRVKAGYQTNTFLSLQTLLYSIVGGLSVFILLSIHYTANWILFSKILFISIIFLLISVIGHKIALLNTNKAHSEKAVISLNIIILLLLGSNIFAIHAQYVSIIASILALLLVFAEKYLAVGQSQRNNIIPEPYSHFSNTKPYSPALKEWNVFIGSLAICILISYGIIYLK